MARDGAHADGGRGRLRELSLGPRVPQAVEREERSWGGRVHPGRGSRSLLPRRDAGPGPQGGGCPLGGAGRGSGSTGRTGGIRCRADPGAGARGPVWLFQRDIRSGPWGPVRRLLAGLRRALCCARLWQEAPRGYLPPGRRGIRGRGPRRTGLTQASGNSGCCLLRAAAEI